MSVALTTETLPTIRLGATDMQITRVGFGSWAVGGGDWAVGWGDQEDSESIAAIQYAVRAGVNWIDTAAIYGLGRSEEVVGKALADIPESERPYIFTKCGLLGDKADPNSAPRQVGKASSIKTEVEESLRRLGVERIDLYQMHWPAKDAEIAEYWQALLDLKAAGKVRAIGLSNHNAAQLEAAEARGHVDTLQPPFSAIKREAAAEILPWCHRHNTGVIVYSPMQAGLLTGAFSKARVKSLPKNDWRSRNAEFTENLDRNLAVAEAMETVARRHNVPTPAVATAWTLAWPGVTAAIVGARSAKQVDGWLPAATLRLTAQDMSEIAAVIEDKKVGSGPASPSPVL